MPEGTLVTFYSYKGGVGRTFALANVGAALASWGYRVLCVDWDLEAPGLHHYFKSHGPQPGLVDLVTAIKDQVDSNWREFITPVRLANDVRIDLIGAGRQDESYISRVQQLHWVELYEQCGLAQHLEHWRHEWKQTYDLVLIDSRTGITDIGALCTAHLPDILTVVFTANHQSLDGCLRVVERAEIVRRALPFDRAALPIVPIPSHFDAREEYEQAKRWQLKFESRIGTFYHAWAEKGTEPADLIARTTIPYIAYWSFGEGLPVIEEKVRATDSIRFYLETIAALLAQRLSNTKLLVESSENYINMAMRAGQRIGGDKYDIYLSCTPDLSGRASELQQSLQASGFRVFLAPNEPQIEVNNPKEAELALDQSRHGVFLIGHEYSSRIEGEIRRFAKQVLDEETGRSLLPICFSNESVQLLPAILEHSRIQMAENVSTQALSRLIIDAIKTRTADNQVSSETESQIELALSRLNDRDSLSRVGAVTILGRIGDYHCLDKVIERLGDEDARVRAAAETSILNLRERLGTHGVDVAALLRKNLGNKNAYWLKAVAELMVPLEGTQAQLALRALLPHLSDSDATIRMNAARALARTRSPDAVDWLLPRLADKDDEVRSAVSGALASIASDQAIRGVLEFLSSERYTYSDVEEAFLHYSNEEVADFLVTQLEDGRVGRLAYQLLVRMGSPRSFNPLSKALSHVKRNVRQKAAAALGELGDARAVDALLIALTEQNPEVRVAAAAALGRLGDARAVDALLIALTEQNPEVRVAAATALGELGDARAVDALLIALTEQNPEVRVAAATALGRLGDARAVDALLIALTEQNPEVRVAAATALGRLGDARAVDALLIALTEQNPEVRVAAAAALGELQDARALDGLLAALADRDEEMRRVSLGILGRKVTSDPLDMRLLSRDLDAVPPWIDPNIPITEEYVNQISTQLRVAPEVLRSRYENLNRRLANKLKLGWSGENHQP
jgi:HEAT repeat protein/MinD-like ATPase involved in chromosome partitioning or flagellar assembly